MKFINYIIANENFGTLICIMFLCASSKITVPCMNAMFRWSTKNTTRRWL